MKGADRFAGQAVAGVSGKVGNLRHQVYLYHAVIQGNKKTERLACLASTSEGQPLDQTDINNLWDIGRVENFEEGELTLILRLNDLEVKTGIARNEC